MDLGEWLVSYLCNIPLSYLRRKLKVSLVTLRVSLRPTHWLWLPDRVNFHGLFSARTLFFVPKVFHRSCSVGGDVAFWAFLDVFPFSNKYRMSFSSCLIVVTSYGWSYRSQLSLVDYS